MAESSSSLKPGNGSSHVNGKMNGQTPARKRPAQKRRNYMAWALNAIARLAIWAAILSLLFRCPSSLEACDDASPFICKHYFQAKAVVSPYAQPYYQQFIEPYVASAKPYCEAIDGRVLAPARLYAVQYGAPWFQKGHEHAWSQWEKHGQPRVAQLRARSQKQYDETIAPYLTQAGEAFRPYYEIGRTNSLQLFYEFLLPTYEYVQPYALQGYDAASSFATGTALPAAHWTWNKTNAFLDKAIWPQMRILYVQNVEPQLVRIGERLGRYKNQAKTKVLPQAASTSARRPESPVSSFSRPAPQSTTFFASSASQNPTSVDSSEPEKPTEGYWNPVQAPPPAENETEQRKKTREMVAQDLEMWQNKFAAQADEGAVDMEDRIDEIARRMIDKEADTKGKPLIEKLESTVQSETDNLKLKISTIIADSSESTADDAQEQVTGAIRSAGVAIKKAAQGIRGWREDYDKELQQAVLSAADVHFQILDETRGLALQQIGMKWAWTDGVTYKDWAKYHELKRTLSEWTEELKQLIVTHPTLFEAQEASAQIEDDGMVIASVAAKELARLKQVAHWKISAKDATDNFESEAMRLAAEAAQKPAEVEEDDTDSKETAKAASAVTEKTDEEAAEAPSSSAEEQFQTESQSLSSHEPEEQDATGDADQKLSTTEEDATSTLSASVEKLASDAPSLADEAQDTLGGGDDKVPEPADETTVDSISKSGVPVATVDGSEEAVEPSTAPSSTKAAYVREEDSDPSDEDEDTPRRQDHSSTTDMSSVKTAFLGAAAQVVSGRQPVLDEDDDTDMFSSATSAAEAAYSSAVSLASGHYSSAVSIISAQIYGTPEPVHNHLLSSVSSAYDNALAAASSKLGQVIDAASSGVYGTPTVTPATPTLVDWSRVESIAAERLHEGKLWAELRYQSALVAFGLATPTPTSPVDRYYEQAKYKYYAGIGVAHDRYTSFVAAASSAWSSITATPTPTTALADSASSLASAAGRSVASAVHAAGEAAESVYSAASENVVSAVEAVDDSLSSVSDAAAEQAYLAGAAMAESWETVIGELSAHIYGQPTLIDWYDGGAATVTEARQTGSADAAKQYEAVNELVSELIIGREPPFTESVLSRLSAAYATAVVKVGSLASEASAAVGSVGDKVGGVVSKATEAAKEDVRDEL